MNQSTLRPLTVAVSICRSGLNRCSLSVRPNASQSSPRPVSLRAASSIVRTSVPLQATTMATRIGRRFISSEFLGVSGAPITYLLDRAGRPRRRWRAAEANLHSGTMTDIERALDGRYRIERELGRGGMGAVYLARDLRLDRPVALKVLPPEFAANASLRERFLRETRTAASFSHPNIVPVHGVEEHDGVLAFAMGFV